LQKLKELKMKKLLGVLSLVLVLASCQEQQKIGYINNGVVINDYLEKKDLEEKYKVKETAFLKKYDSLEQAFNIEAQKFQIEAQSMSQNKAQEKYQQLGQKKQIQDQQKQFEANQLTQAFQTEIDSVIVKVKSFVNDYGKNNGYTYILGTSDTAASVLYGKEENDLSQIILDALNADYKKEK